MKKLPGGGGATPDRPDARSALRSPRREDKTCPHHFEQNPERRPKGRSSRYKVEGRASRKSPHKEKMKMEATERMSYTLGIDLAEATFDAAVAPEGCDPGQWRSLAHTHVEYPPDSREGVGALIAWLDAQCPGQQCVRVIVESTGRLSQRFARTLRDEGELPEVCIINPLRSNAYGKALGVKDKTDRNDSAILAVYGSVHRLEPVLNGSEAEEKLRELTRMRKSYVQEVGNWENRLRQTDDEATRRCVQQTIRHLKKQIEELDKAIEAKVSCDATLDFQVRSLKKIRCIKQVVATTLTAELGDLRRYSRSQLVGRVGLFGRKFESGTSVKRRPRLAKGGCAAARTALYMAATSVWSSKGELRKYAHRLEERGMERMVINMALMRKLLLMCRAVMMNDGNYNESLILEGAKS